MDLDPAGWACNVWSGLQTMANRETRHDWTLDEVGALHDLPLFELLDRARAVAPRGAPQPTRSSSARCSASRPAAAPRTARTARSRAHYETDVGAEQMLDVDDVLDAARARAKAPASTRFCMGAAWREVKDGPAFDRVLDMVRGVKELGLEACCTLGMLTDEQAARLKDAGLDAYNHNLDTSRENYRIDHHDAHVRRSPRARCEPCATPGSPSARAGSSAWARAIDDRCAMLRRARDARAAAGERADQRARRASRARRSRRCRRSIRSSSCA